MNNFPILMTRLPEYATNFKNAQKNVNVKLSNVCYRRWLDLHIGEEESREVRHKFAVKNEWNIFFFLLIIWNPVPNQRFLKNISFIEKKLITQVCTQMLHIYMFVLKNNFIQFMNTVVVFQFHQSLHFGKFIILIS